MSLSTIDPSILPSLADLPAGVPPKGVEANFHNPFTLAPLIYSIGTIFVFIMLFFVGVRFYAKMFLIGGYTWDDLTCLIAALGTIEQLITACLIAKDGAGTHQWDLKIGAVINRDFIVSGAAFVVATLPIQMFARLTLFILYFQIFHPNPNLRRWIWIGGLVNTGFYFATSIAQFYYLIPGPGKTWIGNINLDPNSPNATVGVVASSFGMLSDFYLFTLPAIGIMQLQMSKERKLGLISIFGSGLLGCVVGVVALVYRLRSKNGTDGTYQLFPPMILIIIELSVGISCSCMPAARSVTRRHFQLFSGLGTYFSLLRTRGTKVSDSERNRQEEYNVLTNERHGSARLSQQYSNLEELELGQLPPAKTLIKPGKRWDVQEDIIHVQREVHQVRDPSQAF